MPASCLISRRLQCKHLLAWSDGSCSPLLSHSPMISGADALWFSSIVSFAIQHRRDFSNHYHGLHRPLGRRCAPLKCTKSTLYECRGEWVSLLVGQSVHLKSRAPFSFISHFLYFLSIFSLDYINSACLLEKCSSPLFCNCLHFSFPNHKPWSISTSQRGGRYLLIPYLAVGPWYGLACPEKRAAVVWLYTVPEMWDLPVVSTVFWAHERIKGWLAERFVSQFHYWRVHSIACIFME